MSKNTKIALSTLSKNIHDGVILNSKQIKEAETDAKFYVEANSGIATKCSIEVKSNVAKATQMMNDSIIAYSKSFDEMVKKEVEIVNQVKVLTQKSKDYACQIGDALARIDKVLIKDFEVKLLLLERFVIASKEMAELEKSGALQKIAVSFVK
jgi:hypothetical protein